MNRAERIEKDNRAFLKKAKNFYLGYNKRLYSWPEYLSLDGIKRLVKTHSWHRPDMGGRIDQKKKLLKEKRDAQRELREELNY